MKLTYEITYKIWKTSLSLYLVYKYNQNLYLLNFKHTNKWEKRTFCTKNTMYFLFKWSV